MMCFIGNSLKSPIKKIAKTDNKNKFLLGINFNGKANQPTNNIFKRMKVYKDIKINVS
jgi:hypothetical protein